VSPLLRPHLRIPFYVSPLLRPHLRILFSSRLS
jgi:hypothetical protein